MSLSIPPSGTHAFAIPTQKVGELQRLNSTRSLAPMLQLDFGRGIVNFYRVLVLQVYAAPSAGEVDLLTVILRYESRSVMPMGMGGIDSMRSISSPAETPAGTDTIMGQLQADSARRSKERLQIMNTIQTQIFQVQQDITVNKSKTADKAFNAMDAYIRS